MNMMMTTATRKIIWFSRHEPLPSQVELLREKFPGAVVLTDRRPFYCASQVQIRYEESGGDDLVVVAPLPVLHDLVCAGLRPLVADMQSEGRSRNGGRFYSCRGFKRIVALEYKTEEI